MFGANSLRQVGAVDPVLPLSEESWALIGYKGDKTMDWIKQMSRAKGMGPSKIVAKIQMQEEKKPKAVSGRGSVCFLHSNTKSLTISRITVDGRRNSICFLWLRKKT